jgi:hypothetical protein
MGRSCRNQSEQSHFKLERSQLMQKFFKFVAAGLSRLTVPMSGAGLRSCNQSDSHV